MQGKVEICGVNTAKLQVLTGKEPACWSNAAREIKRLGNN